MSCRELVPECNYHLFEAHLDCQDPTLAPFPRGTVIVNYDAGQGVMHSHTFLYDASTEPFRTLFASPERVQKDLEWQEQAGQAVAGILFPANQEITAAFTDALARHSNIRLRLVYLPSDKESCDVLLSIPWEYMYFVSKTPLKIEGFLCTQLGFSLVHSFKSSARNPAVEALPVKVAFLSVFKDAAAPGNDDDGKDFKDVQDEVLMAQRSRIVQMERWGKPTEITDFTTAFHSYDIVQSLSHGSSTAFTLEDSEVTSELLKDKVKGQECQAAAVVLCACNTGGSENGPAVALHEAGIPVVIAMSHSIKTERARQFMEDFYAKLAVSACSLEQALAVTRAQLFEIKKDTGGTLKGPIDWGLPRLFLAGATGRLIAKRHLYAPCYAGLVQNFDHWIDDRTPLPSDATAFNAMDRGNFTNSDEVQDIIQWIESEDDILYFHAPSGSGKSTDVARVLRDYRFQEDGVNRPEHKLAYHICIHRSMPFDPNAGAAGLQSADKAEIVNHPLVFVRDSLFPQLEKLYGEDTFHSWMNPGVYPILMDSAKEALEYLVINPLVKAGVQPGGQPIIVVDGLDFAVESHSEYSILDLLIDYRDRLTEVARLFVIANSDVQAVDRKIRCGLLRQQDQC